MVHGRLSSEDLCLVGEKTDGLTDRQVEREQCALLPFFFQTII
jgi:hypothetical protein